MTYHRIYMFTFISIEVAIVASAIGSLFGTLLNLNASIHVILQHSVYDWLPISHLRIVILL